MTSLLKLHILQAMDQIQLNFNDYRDVATSVSWLGSASSLPLAPEQKVSNRKEFYRIEGLPRQHSYGLENRQRVDDQHQLPDESAPTTPPANDVGIVSELQGWT